MGSRHRAGLSTWSPLSARLRGKNCRRKAAAKPLALVTIVSAIDGRPSGACTSCSIDCNPQDSGSQSPKLQWLRRLARRCCKPCMGARIVPQRPRALVAHYARLYTSFAECVVSRSSDDHGNRDIVLMTCQERKEVGTADFLFRTGSMERQNASSNAVEHWQEFACRTQS